MIVVTEIVVMVLLRIFVYPGFLTVGCIACRNKITLQYDVEIRSSVLLIDILNMCISVFVRHVCVSQFAWREWCNPDNIGHFSCNDITWSFICVHLSYVWNPIIPFIWLLLRNTGNKLCIKHDFMDCCELFTMHSYISVMLIINYVVFCQIGHMFLCVISSHVK